MFTFIWSLFIFVITAGILIIVHEWGHFIVARRLQIPIEKFSFGFGRALYTYVDDKGTQWCLAILPLGGYVKMCEPEMPADPEDSLQGQYFFQQSIAKRIAVVLAGPMANLLFAFLAFTLMYQIGFNVPKAIIGTIIPSSIAAQSKLQKGMQITQINQQKIQTWPQVIEQIKKAWQQQQDLQIKTVHAEKILQAIIAFKKTFSQVMPENYLSYLGIKMFMPAGIPTVGKLIPDSPAAQAGIQPGDKILQINQQKIYSWQQLEAILQQVKQHPAIYHIQRKQHLLTLTLAAKLGNEHQQGMRYVIGIVSKPLDWPSQYLVRQRVHLGVALQKAFLQMGQLSWVSVQTLYNIVIGNASIRQLTGPIAIAHESGVVVKRGSAYYVGFLGILSLSLAIINLLPIPMLDGGHLVFYIYEAIVRHPFPEFARILGMQFGLLLLIGVTLVVSYSDLLRLAVIK